MDYSNFQLLGYLHLLNDAGVRFVIVGGVGARLQGSGTSTQDLDIMIDPDFANIENLVKALNELGAKVQRWGADDFTDEVLTGEVFKTPDTVRIVTSYGVLDVLAELPAIGYYDEVARNARKYGFDNLELVVADISDIRKSKEAADRVKDLHTLDALRAAEERIKSEGDPYELPADRIDEDD